VDTGYPAHKTRQNKDLKIHAFWREWLIRQIASPLLRRQRQTLDNQIKIAICVYFIQIKRVGRPFGCPPPVNNAHAAGQLITEADFNIDLAAGKQFWL